MLLKPHPGLRNSDNSEEKQRIISEATEFKLAKIHSFAQYVIIGATGLYLLVRLSRTYLGIPDTVFLGDFGYLDIDTATTLTGAIIGAITAKLLSLDRKSVV